MNYLRFKPYEKQAPNPFGLDIKHYKAERTTKMSVSDSNQHQMPSKISTPSLYPPERNIDLTALIAMPASC